MTSLASGGAQKKTLAGRCRGARETHLAVDGLGSTANAEHAGDPNHRG